MSDGLIFGNPHLELDSVDCTKYLAAFRIDVLPPPELILPPDFRTPAQIMGEARTTLSPDEYANLSEHVVFSDEPGEL